MVGSSEGLSKEGMIELCLNLKDDSQWQRRAGAETKAWRWGEQTGFLKLNIKFGF